MTSKIGSSSEEFGLFDDVAEFADDDGFWATAQHSNHNMLDTDSVRTVTTNHQLQPPNAADDDDLLDLSSDDDVSPPSLEKNESASFVSPEMTFGPPSNQEPSNVSSSVDHSIVPLYNGGVYTSGRSAIGPSSTVFVSSQQPTSSVSHASAVSCQDTISTLDATNEPIPDEPTCSRTGNLFNGLQGATTVSMDVGGGSPSTITTGGVGVPGAPMLQLVNGRLLLQAPLQQVNTPNGPMMVVLVPGCLQQLAQQQHQQQTTEMNAGRQAGASSSPKIKPAIAPAVLARHSSTKPPQRVLAPKRSAAGGLLTKRSPRNTATPTHHHAIESTPTPPPSSSSYSAAVSPALMPQSNTDTTPLNLTNSTAPQVLPPQVLPPAPPNPSGLTVQLSNEDARTVGEINAQIARIKANEGANGLNGQQLLQALERERMRILSTAFVQQHSNIASEQLSNCLNSSLPPPLAAPTLPISMNQPYQNSADPPQPRPQPKLIEINGQKFLVFTNPNTGDSSGVPPVIPPSQFSQPPSTYATTVPCASTSSYPPYTTMASLSDQQHFLPAPQPLMPNCGTERNEQPSNCEPFVNPTPYANSTASSSQYFDQQQSSYAPQTIPASGNVNTSGFAQSTPMATSIPDQFAVAGCSTVPGDLYSASGHADAASIECGDALEKSRLAVIRARLKERFDHDVWRVTNPDKSTPFADRADVVDRLLPYNVYHQTQLPPEVLADIDAKTEETFGNLMDHYQNLESRLRVSLLKDTMAKRWETTENSLISYLLAKHESEVLAQERILADENIDEFVSSSAIIRLNRPDFCAPPSSDSESDFEDVNDTASDAVAKRRSPGGSSPSCQSSSSPVSSPPCATPPLDETHRAALQLRSAIRISDDERESSASLSPPPSSPRRLETDATTPAESFGDADGCKEERQLVTPTPNIKEEHPPGIPRCRLETDRTPAESFGDDVDSCKEEQQLVTPTQLKDDMEEEQPPLMPTEDSSKENDQLVTTPINPPVTSALLSLEAVATVDNERQIEDIPDDVISPSTSKENCKPSPKEIDTPYPFVASSCNPHVTEKPPTFVENSLMSPVCSEAEPRAPPPLKLHIDRKNLVSLADVTERKRKKRRKRKHLDHSPSPPPIIANGDDAVPTDGRSTSPKSVLESTFGLQENTTKKLTVEPLKFMFKRSSLVDPDSQTSLLCSDRLQPSTTVSAAPAATKVPKLKIRIGSIATKSNHSSALPTKPEPAHSPLAISAVLKTDCQPSPHAPCQRVPSPCSTVPPVAPPTAQQMPAFGLEQSDDDDDVGGRSDSSEELGVFNQLRNFLRDTRATTTLATTSENGVGASEQYGHVAPMRLADRVTTDDHYCARRKLVTPMAPILTTVSFGHFERNEDVEVGGFVRDDVNFHSPPAPFDADVSPTDHLRNQTRSVIESLSEFVAQPRSSGTLKMKLPRRQLTSTAGSDVRKPSSKQKL